MNLPGDLEAEERRLVEALRHVRQQLACARLQARILTYLEQQQDVSTSNDVVLGVKAGRSAVLSALRDLQRSGRLAWSPGGWRGGSGATEPRSPFRIEPHAQPRKVRS